MSCIETRNNEPDSTTAMKSVKYVSCNNDSIVKVNGGTLLIEFVAVVEI